MRPWREVLDGEYPRLNDWLQRIADTLGAIPLIVLAAATPLGLIKGIPQNTITVAIGLIEVAGSIGVFVAVLRGRSLSRAFWISIAVFVAAWVVNVVICILFFDALDVL